MKTLYRTAWTLIFCATPFASAADLTEIKVTEGKVTAAKMPEPQDRSQGSKAAAAAAAAGAASGKVNCLMLMDQARKASDDQKKMMLTMMAGQQCQQAAALEQSAKNNEKGQKQLSMKDVPTAAKYEPGSTTLIEGSAKDIRIDFDENAPSRAAASTAADSLVDGSGTSNSGAATNPVAQNPELQAAEKVQAQAEPPKSSLNSIEANKVSFDDGPKGTIAGQLFGGASLGLGSTPTSTKSESLSPSPSKADGPGNLGGARRSAETNYLNASGGDGSNNGEDPIDALMSQLMGEPTPAEAGPSEFGEQLWTENERAPQPESDRVNIFEYAAIRYQKLHTEQDRLVSKREGATAARSERSIASVKSLQ
jgi:hypothetical protein